MPTTAELIRKELEAKKKRDEQHKAVIKKYEDAELKRVHKILKKADFYGVEISDDELLREFERIIKPRKQAMKNEQTGTHQPIA